MKRAKNIKTLSFVIPVFNEEKRIAKTFEALLELAFPYGLKLEEIIFVNDGSTDRTKFKIENLKLKIEKTLRTKITIISYKKNMGKGFAIKTGMLASNSDYALFFDADISTPLFEIKKLVPFINKTMPVIVGTRKNGKSTVIKHQPIFRELLGRGFTLISQITLNLTVSDFTCGFKAFERSAKDVIFAKSRISGWGCDAEALFLAKKYNFQIAEVAVVWSDVKDSKVKLYKAVPQTLRDLLFIRWYNGRDDALSAFTSLLRVLLPQRV